MLILSQQCIHILNTQGIEIESRRMGRLTVETFRSDKFFLQSLIIWAKREYVWSGASLTFCSVDWICFFIGGFFSFLHSTLNNMECVRGLTAELCTKKCTHNELHANIRFNMKIPNYRVSMRIFPSHVTGYIKASVENFNQIFFLKLLLLFLFHSDDERATHSSIVLLSFTQ